MSTTEMAPPNTKGNATFEKRGYRPWTVDILESALDEDHTHRDYMADASSLHPALFDAIYTPLKDTEDNMPIVRIGGFLDLSALYTPSKANYFPPKATMHYNLEGQEEVTLLKERLHKIEQLLESERALRLLLEEKLSCYGA